MEIFSCLFNVQIESPPNAVEWFIGLCFALLLWYAGYRNHNLCLDSLAGRADSECSVLLSGEKLHWPLLQMLTLYQVQQEMRTTMVFLPGRLATKVQGLDLGEHSRCSSDGLAWRLAAAGLNAAAFLGKPEATGICSLR